MILQNSDRLSLKKVREATYLDEPTKDFLAQYLRIENEFKFALREMSAKLENLDDYCQSNFDHNPIHHIESRLKTPEGIVDKIRKRGFEMTMESLKENIYDIAGIRVICKYINDIYQIINLLSIQKDVSILVQKDYILKPKESGYRSVHIVFGIQMYLQDGGPKIVPVEVQFRTIAMDMWASLEHELRYKSNNKLSEWDKYYLKKNSDDLYNVDLGMQRIYIATTTGERNDD